MRWPGPLIGAAAFTWLSDTLARATEYWRAVLERHDACLIVIVVPDGDRRHALALAAAEGSMSAAGPPQGANGAPSGGSAAASLTNEAASVGAVQSSAVLRVDGLTKSFGGDDVVHDVSFAGRRRGARRADRPQRGGQDHVLQPRQRPARARTPGP